MTDTQLLVDLVSIFSPSQQEQSAVDYLVGWMTNHGFEAWRDEVGNAVGRRGNPEAEHTLMLLGHIDTVAGEIKVRVENDCLYGRGSVDAKGSLCTFAQATAEATIPENWQVIVVGAVEEEISSSKGARHIRDQYQPDLCIIGEPSSSDRITLGYKGRLLVNVTIVQELVHTSRDEPSVGALGSDIWQTIDNHFTAINAERQALFDKVLCRLQSFNTAADGFHEKAELVIGFRLPLDYPPDTVEGIIRDLVDDNVHLEFYGREHAYRGEKNSPLVRGLLRAIRAQGKRPAFVVKTGTSDMNVVGTKWDCPMVAYGPGDSNLDHTPYEHLNLTEYAEAVEVLCEFITAHLG